MGTMNRPAAITVDNIGYTLEWAHASVLARRVDTPGHYVVLAWPPAVNGGRPAFISGALIHDREDRVADRHHKALLEVALRDAAGVSPSEDADRH